jgi:hypothetical protein
MLLQFSQAGSGYHRLYKGFFKPEVASIILALVSMKQVQRILANVTHLQLLL